MTNLIFIFRLIGLSFVPKTAQADAHADAFRSSGAKARGSRSIERGDDRAWPPPDGIYWGM